jgi:hypothetical protein
MVKYGQKSLVLTPLEVLTTTSGSRTNLPRSGAPWRASLSALHIVAPNSGITNFFHLPPTYKTSRIPQLQHNLLYK